MKLFVDVCHQRVWFDVAIASSINMHAVQATTIQQRGGRDGATTYARRTASASASMGGRKRSEPAPPCLTAASIPVLLLLL
jgi:hypothetical protein